MTAPGIAEAPAAKAQRQLSLAMQLLRSSLWEFVLTDGLVENSHLDHGAVDWESGRGSPAGTDFVSSIAAFGVLPDDRLPLAQAIQACVDGKTPVFHCVLRLGQPGGAIRWQLVRGTVARDSDGTARYFTGVCSDITERKRVEEDSRHNQGRAASYTDSEYRWRSLAETLPLLVFTAAGDGTIEYLGTQATEYTGRTEQDMLGAGWAESIHPDDLERTGKSWFAAIEKQQTHEVQHRIRRWDGEYRWFTTRAQPARDSAGRVFKWVGTCTDVTDLKQLEEALQRTKDRLELAVRSSNLSIFEFELTDGRLENSQHTLINFWEQLGYDPSEVPASFAQAALLVLTPEGLAHVPAEMQGYLSGEIPRFEMEHQVRHRDGSLHWRLARGMALRNEHGIAVRFIGSHVDITDRKRIEHKLREGEQRWRTLVETVPHLVFTTEPNGEVDHFSAQTLAFLGRPESDLLGSAWTDAIHPDDLEYIGREWAKSIELQLPHETHHRVRRSDGEYRWMTTRAIPLRDEAGRVLKWFGTSTDITAMKQLEAELRHAKELLELGIRGSNVAIFDFDMPDGRIETARQTMINVWETLGYDPATAPSEFGPGAMLAIHPDDIARVQQEIGAYLAGQSQNFEAEYRVRHKDGSVHWRIARGTAFRDADHRPIRFIGSFFDITHIKRVEDKLRESEERWRTLAETLPQLVWSATADGAADYLSVQCQRFTGRPEAELVGAGWLDVIHPDDRAATIEVWSTAVQTESLYNVDYRIRRADGVYRWFAVRGAPLRDRTGRAYKWVGACTDIEDGKQLAERLRESEQAWQELAEMVPHFVWTAPADGSVDYYSAQATEYTGLAESELLGSSWAQTLHPEDREHTVTAWLAALAQQQPHNVEHRVRRHDGTYQWFSTRAVPILNRTGHTVRWFGTNTNIESFKRLEAELRHTRDLLVLGVRGSKVSIFEFDMPDGKIENSLKTWFNLWESLGYDPATAPADFSAGSALAIHPDDLQRVHAEIQAYLNGESEDFETEYRVRRKDGTVLWHLARGVAFRDPNGMALRFIGSCVDITDRKRVEQQLRGSEQRWRGHAESLPQFVFTTTPDGIADYFSAKTSAYTGFLQSELVGWAWGAAIHPDDVEHTTRTWLENCANQRPHQVEHRIRRADGVYRWFTTRAAAVWDDEGNIVTWFGTCTDIENLKQLELELRHTRDLLELAVRGSKVSIFDFDMPDGEIENARQTMINLWESLGYDPLTAPTRFAPGAELAVHPDDLARVRSEVRSYLYGARKDFEIEFRVRHRDGAVIWHLARGLAYRDAEGKPLRFIGSFVDITDKKEVEGQHRESEQRWRTLSEALPLLVWSANAQGVPDYFSAQTVEFTGVSEVDLCGDGWLNSVHPEDRAHGAEVWLKAIATQSLYQVDFRIRRADGVYRWFTSRARPVLDSGGRVSRWFGTCTDIEDGKRLAEELRASEQRWQTLAEMVPHFVWSATADGMVDYYSAQATAYTGLPERELHGISWAQTLHPEDREHTVKAWLEAVAQQRPHTIEHRVRRHDGTYQWLSTRAVPILDSSSHTVRWFGTNTNVEGFKRLEADLRHAKDLLELGVRGSKVAIFDFAMPDGTLDTANQTMINLWESLGYDPALAPKDFRTGALLAVHPDDLERVRAEAELYLSGERGDFEVEFRVRHKDGSVLWYLSRGLVYRDVKARPVRFIGSFVDITDKKLVEERHRQSEQRWQTLTETLPQLVWSANADGTGEYFSTQAEKFIGLPEAELIGAGWLNAIHPDDRAHTVEVWSAALRTESLYEVDFRIRRADGVYRWFTTRAEPLRDGTGRVFRWVGTCTDIEGGKQLAEKLRASEERWRSHAESLPQFVFTMTPDGMADYFSTTTSAYTGLPQAELLGWGWGEAIHPGDRERTIATWLDNLGNRRAHEVEHRIRGADGAYRWFTTRAAAVLDGSGEIVAWFGTCTDIEDLKQLEADLRQAKERLELAIRSANLCIWEYDMPNGTLENSRETLTNVWESFGYDVLDAPPMVAAVIHPDDLARVNERIMACLHGDTPAFEAEHRVRHKDGAYHWILGRGVTLRDAEGRPTRFVGTSVDINDIKRIEADLLRAREAAESANRAKDEFLANVSHEIRTPMNAILGMTELALDSARTEHQRQLLSTVRTAARNLLNIINDLLDFSKIAAGKLALDEADFSLRGALSDTVRALAPRAHRKGLELVSQVSSDVPDSLFGDAGRLRQVLMNLIGNALKFTAQGEVVVAVVLDSRAADSILLRFAVRDTGIGIARDKQAAIFRAFEQEDASTTRKYGGTGLGLTISSQLVALMGGEISVQSEPGRGSTFGFSARFALSSRAELGAEAISPKVLEHLPVLVVDDNETNRQVLVDRLTEWRMRPLAVGDAASALDALVRAEAQGTPFALVLLDARMPDLDGITLAAEIQARFGSSSQRLILLSSDDDPVLPTRSREAGIKAYLLKPVQHSELLETIWAVMNTESPPEQSKETTNTVGESLARRVALRILVAEDNELNVALLRELLTQSGHSAEFAGDGRTALVLSTTESFDLLLLDLHMPEMDGFEVVQAIRQEELTTGRHLPIIALTARSSNRDRARCLAAGMDDFLSKPIEADALWAAIDRMVLAFPPTRSRPSRLIDHRALSRACGGRQAVLVKLCEVFQRSLPDHMANVRLALRERDLHQLSRAAHKLYGTLAAFSTIAGALALTLEDLAKQEDVESSAELVDRLEAMCSELLDDTRSLVQQGHLR